MPSGHKTISIENAQNGTKIEENWKEESKETIDDCCRKLPNNESPGDNASPSVPERMEELCSPNSSKFPKLNVPSSGQTIGYEQIQG